MAKENSKMSLEDKVDLLLKYQKSARRWAMIGGIIKLVIFFVIFVLPVLWAISFFRDLLSSAAFQNVQSGLGQFGAAASAPGEAANLIKNLLGN